MKQPYGNAYGLQSLRSVYGAFWAGRREVTARVDKRHGFSLGKVALILNFSDVLRLEVKQLVPD